MHLWLCIVIKLLLEMFNLDGNVLKQLVTKQCVKALKQF